MTESKGNTNKLWGNTIFGRPRHGEKSITVPIVSTPEQITELSPVEAYFQEHGTPPPSPGIMTAERYFIKEGLSSATQ